LRRPQHNQCDTVKPVLKRLPNLTHFLNVKNRDNLQTKRGIKVDPGHENHLFYPLPIANPQRVRKYRCNKNRIATDFQAKPKLLFTPVRRC